MLETRYLYLGLMMLSILYPIAQSFERRIKLYKQWKPLFSGVIVMMLIFIPWDIYFTYSGVWWFNDRYLTGIRLFFLPIEEWLFFIIVPYACVFLYEVLNYFIKKDFFKPVASWFFGVMIVGMLFSGFVYIDRLYTSLTMFATSLALMIFLMVNPPWKGRFLFMYLISWIPFLLLNGALTGNFTEAAVVNYQPTAFMGFKITTIPVEDSIYSMLMLLIVITVYEHMKNRAKQS